METLIEIFTWATELIDSLAQLVTDSPLTYLVIFAMSAIDVILPILPAEATVTAAAVLAGQGTLNIVWVMIAAGVGAFVGDNIAYWIGRAAGRPLVEKVLRGNTGQLESVQAQFDERGGMFVIVGRFIPGGRTVVAVGAGVLHFNWLQFLLYDAIAAVVWALQAALPGFIGGQLVQDRPWLAMVFGFGLSIVLALGIALFQRWRDGKRVRAAADAADADAVVTPRAPLPKVKPAVVGIGGVDAKIDAGIEQRLHADRASASGGDPASAQGDPGASTGEDEEPR